MKWPEGQGGGAEVRNDFTITDPRGDRAVKRAKLALLLNEIPSGFSLLKLLSNSIRSTD